MVTRYDDVLAPKFYWDDAEIDSLEWDIDRFFVRPELPVITTLTITPSVETAAQRTTRNAPLRIDWEVETETGYTASPASVLARQTGLFNIRSTVITGTINPASDVLTAGISPQAGHTTFNVNFVDATTMNATSVVSVNVGGTNYPASVFTEIDRFNQFIQWRIPTLILTVSPATTYSIQVTLRRNNEDIPLWVTESAGAVPTLALSVTTEDGTRTPVSIGQTATGNITVATPTQDLTADLTATNVEGTSVAHAHYEYNVPPVINAFAASVQTYGTAHPLARVTFTGNYNVHTAVSADITIGGQSLNLLSRQSGGGNTLRYVTEGGSPAWLYTLNANAHLTLGRTPGTAITRGALLRIVGRDGTTATRNISVTTPA